jgi:small-conductance mechanosensitive channel
MKNFLEWLGKFFGHIDVSGLEAMAIKGLQALLVILAAYWISRMIQRIIVRSIKNDKKAVHTYRTVVRYVVMPLGFVMALHIMGLNLSTFFHTGGLLAIAAAFAMKDIANNIVSGFILKAERLIKPGDVLESHTHGVMIKVEKIGFRGIVAKTKDSKNVLVPNSEFIQSWIANYKYENTLCQVWALIGVAYSSDLKKVRQVFEQTCNKMDCLSDLREPEILLLGFGESAVNYKVSVWIETPWISGQVKSELNEAVWWALKEAGIEIAFPQLDVHLDDVVASK